MSSYRWSVESIVQNEMYQLKQIKLSDRTNAMQGAWWTVSDSPVEPDNWKTGSNRLTGIVVP